MKRGFLKNKKLAPVTTNDGDQTATVDQPKTAINENVPQSNDEKVFLKNKSLTPNSNNDLATSNDRGTPSSSMQCGYLIVWQRNRERTVHQLRGSRRTTGVAVTSNRVFSVSAWSPLDSENSDLVLSPTDSAEEVLNVFTQNGNIARMEFVKRDPRTVSDYPVGQPVMTTIPLRYPYQTVAIGANGWAECILKDVKLKQAILSIPGFPHSVPSFDPPRYRIGPSEHGTGMFAACDIDQGELILAERPVMVMIRELPVLHDFTRKQQLAQVEKFLEMCVERMLPQDRKAFFELFIGPENVEEGSGPIFRRMGTNGIGIRLGAGKYGVHAGTFINAARMNHRPSFSLRVHAVRPIKAGEEICVSYMDTTVPKAERQRLLRPYGFECSCTACCDPTYDQRISIIKQNSDMDNIPPHLKGRPELILHASLQWLKAIEELKAQAHEPYWVHVARVARTATTLGRKEMAKKYEALAEKMQFIVTDHPIPDLWASANEYLSRKYNISL
ncbi:hypothetical protein H0H93_011216 [Arthromyces matolae]|nr:hypothetical protein H0H93_011216 [Arthromyces matolae]